MNSNNVIVIDLDDTLLNSFAMYEAAIKELEHFGVTTKNFWTAEKRERQQRAIIDGKRDYYSFFNHMLILSAMLGLDRRGFEEMQGNVLDFIRKNSGNFLYSDCADFLFFFNRSVNLILMTSGPTDLQSAKLKGIGASGFVSAEYFKRIIIADMLKGHHIGEVCSPDNRLNVFIDDSPRQINSVAKERPDIITIWLDRKKKKVNKGEQGEAPDCDYAAQNFYEIDDILSEMI